MKNKCIECNNTKFIFNSKQDTDSGIRKKPCPICNWDNYEYEDRNEK